MTHKQTWQLSTKNTYDLPQSRLERPRLTSDGNGDLEGEEADTLYEADSTHQTLSGMDSLSRHWTVSRRVKRQPHVSVLNVTSRKENRAAGDNSQLKINAGKNVASRAIQCTAHSQPFNK